MAPSDADETSAAYLASTPPAWLLDGAVDGVRPERSACTSSRRASTSKTTRSPSRTRAMGPPRAASGATCPAIMPWVAPLKRPSVTSATESPSPRPMMRGGDLEHLAHPRAAARALVADDDDVARADGAGLHGRERRLFAVEDARRALVAGALVPGELEDAALGRERAAQDGEAAARLERGRDGAHDGLLRRARWPRRARRRASARCTWVRRAGGRRRAASRRAGARRPRGACRRR